MAIDALTKKWIRTKADEKAADLGYYFDLSAAQRVENFFKTYLRHSIGRFAGKPFELLEWQRDKLIYPLFGWMKPSGKRRFNRAFTALAKKNGKSTVAAAVGLYMLCGDREQGAEIYSAATDLPQAKIVHNEAIRMVAASAALASSLKINRTTSSISYLKTNSSYKALAEGAENKEGVNAHCIIIDELHVWKGDKLWNALKYAISARDQGLIFVITTAGDDALSVCKTQWDYALSVEKGDILDVNFFPYICAADPKDDWTSVSTWQKANPSLGITIPIDNMQQDCEEARAKPRDIASFKRYRLNIWGTSSSAWLRSNDWDLCKRDFVEDDLIGRDCYAGLDLNKKSDMSAFTLVFPKIFKGKKSGKKILKYFLLPYFWLPEETIHAKGAPDYYQIWKEQGLLRATPGNVTDYKFILRDICQLKKRFRILEFAFDPWNALELSQEIKDEAGIKPFEFTQNTANYNEPTQEFERRVLNQTICHNGNGILSWQAGNVEVKQDANGNIRPVKPDKDSPKKIDGIQAAIMGLGRAMLADSPCVYSKRGIRVI